MSKISQVESKQLSLFEKVYESEIELTHGANDIYEPIRLNGNELAKREIAVELLQQGVSEDAVCRILNIPPSLLIKLLPS